MLLREATSASLSVRGGSRATAPLGQWQNVHADLDAATQLLPPSRQRCRSSSSFRKHSRVDRSQTLPLPRRMPARLRCPTQSGRGASCGRRHFFFKRAPRKRVWLIASTRCLQIRRTHRLAQRRPCIQGRLGRNQLLFARGHIHLGRHPVDSTQDRLHVLVHRTQQCRDVSAHAEQRKSPLRVQHLQVARQHGTRSAGPPPCGRGALS